MRTFAAMMAGLLLLGAGTLQAGAWETPQHGGEAGADPHLQPRICFPCEFGICEQVTCILFNILGIALPVARQLCRQALPDACPI